MLLQSANGLWQVLLPLRMQAVGLTTVTIGYVATCYGIGFVIGSIFAPVFVRNVGHIRAFASLAAISAIVALMFSQANNPVTWMILRLISGISMAGLFTVSDSWTSASASSQNRGRVLSIYMIFNKTALVISPLGIGFGSVENGGLFMLVAALMCLSLLPICAANAPEPPIPNTVRINIRKIITLAPSAAIGCFIVGMMNGPVTNLATIYGVNIGMSETLAAALLFAVQAGSLVMQWPLGIISDRFDRRYVIAALGAATSLVCLLIIIATLFGSIPIIFIAIFLWGGIALCIYSVCVAHVCDVMPAGEIVPSVSGLLMIWALGMTIGPAPAAFIMEKVAPWGLFLYSGCAAVFLALFVLWRIRFRKRSPTAGGFVALTPTSPASAPLSPRAEQVEQNETANQEADDSQRLEK